MKIVIVSRFPGDINSPKGGVETATVNLVKALAEHKDLDLHVVTLEPGIQQTTTEELRGITIHRLKRSKFPMLLDVFGGPSARRLRKYIEQLRPDIIHFQETWGFGSYLYSTPTLFTVHGFDSLNLPTEKRAGWKLRSILWRLAESIGIGNQTHLVSIAPYVRKHITQISRAKTYNIWNALDESCFLLDRDNVTPYKILFLGWINPRKNVLTLIQAMPKILEALPQCTLQVCGSESDPDYANQVRQTIEALKLEQVVNLCGQIGQQQVATELSTSDILVLPSLQENAPMVISESMAAGLPVIASNLCGIPDMIENERTGLLIDPFDIDQLSTSIIRLLSDRKLYNSISSAGKQVATENYHPKAVAEMTISAYNEILNRKSRHA